VGDWAHITGCGLSVYDTCSAGVIDANFEIGRCTSGRSAGLASGQVTVADLRK
jgi:hypothetical protein